MYIKSKLIYRNKNQVGGCLGQGWREGVTPEEHQETGSDGCIHDLDLGDGFQECTYVKTDPICTVYGSSVIP